MIGFPLSVTPDGTSKVIGPAVVTGSCTNLVGLSPNPETDYVGPILLPAGDLHASRSFITYVNAGGTWVGTAEIVDFGGTVIATATVDGAGSGFIHVPFDANETIANDTLAYLRFTNTVAGPIAVTSWYLEIVRAGSLPVITTAPVLAWTIELGNTPTLTAPVYTGADGVVTWTLYRDDTPDDTIVDVDTATAQAYAAQWSGTAVGPNDIGCQLRFLAKVTTPAGYDLAFTNAVVFNDVTYLPDTAIGVSTAGITTEDFGTTVDQWAPTLGGLAASTAPAVASSAFARPAYFDTGGVGGRPRIASDGTDDALVGASITRGAAWLDSEMGIVGFRTLYDTVSDTYIGYLDVIYLNDRNVSEFRFTVSGGANVNTGVNPDLTPTHLSGDSDATDLNARQNGTVVGTFAIAQPSRADGNAYSLFASTIGTRFASMSYQAWYLGGKLTTDQRLHLRALLTYHTGISC